MQMNAMKSSINESVSKYSITCKNYRFMWGISNGTQRSGLLRRLGNSIPPAGPWPYLFF